MMRSSVQFVSVCLAVTPALACGSGSSATPNATPNACTYTANSTPTSAVSSEGCAELTFDVSSCLASRQALGLAGAWLRFSCRVALTKTTKNGADYVVITTDNHPQHKSSYYQSTDACYQADSADKSINTSRGITASITTATETMEVLLNPVGKDSSWTEVGKGTVGVAVDGVAILSPLAGPDSWSASHAVARQPLPLSLRAPERLAGRQQPDRRARRRLLPLRSQGLRQQCRRGHVDLQQRPADRPRRGDRGQRRPVRVPLSPQAVLQFGEDLIVLFADRKVLQGDRQQLEALTKAGSEITGANRAERLTKPVDARREPSSAT
jgi:hypothetical protein